MQTYQEAKKAADALDAAAKKYRNDVRFARWRDTAVHLAMQSVHDILPDEYDVGRDRYEVAMATATYLLAMIYENDAEIANLKHMAEQYKNLAIEAVSRSAPQIVMPAPRK